MKLIGFATKFYTLWEYEAEPQYKMNAAGQYSQVGVKHNYYYQKNISFDLIKVKKLYPGISIDETLRGKTQNWSCIKYDEGVFNGGKYEGEKIDDILISDFDYCMWAASNYNKVGDYLKSNPLYIEYIEQQEQERKAAEKAFKNLGWLKVGDEIEITFTTNGFNGEGYDNNTNLFDCCSSKATYKNIELEVKHGKSKSVDGMYPYIMPNVNGETHRIKNKTILVKVTEVSEGRIEFGKYCQYITIN